MLKIDDLKDVFELAATTGTFINELMKIKGTCKNNDIDNAQVASSGYYAKVASSGDYAKVASSGNYAKVASSGNSAQVASSGYYAQVASSGNYAQVASSGNSAQVASSGYYAQVASSGNSAQVASSGNYAQVASSGYYAQVASSGNYAQVASSGNSAKVASSGNSAQVASSGNYAVVAAIGRFNIACAEKGSWITLAEYDNEGKVSFVRTEQVDGERIKEDVFYTLYKKEFHEVEEIDGIKTIILNRKKNVCKTKILNDDKESYIFTKDGVNAHGKTLKQAYRDWLFKTSPRDMSEYEDLKLSDVKDLNYWAICYRTITGACSMGTENFIENFEKALKPKMSLQEVIDITNGHYGSSTFKEFFKK